jgi:uncharacterized membrane protein
MRSSFHFTSFAVQKSVVTSLMKKSSFVQKFFLGLMAAGYIGAGVNHFIHPFNYTIVVPTIFPDPLLIVQLSGIAEIVCGVLLLPARTRRIGAWATIALLVAVFPANVKMATDYYHEGKSMFYVVIRLPLQAGLIWWAWYYTKEQRE